MAISFRDRVVGLERVDPALLDAHPRNWRRHPQEQRSALRSVLEEIGFAGAIIAVKRGDRYLMADGHLRKDEAAGPVPVLIVDLTDQELDKLLATYDSLGAMAKPDESAWSELLASLESQSDPLRATLQAMEATLGFGEKEATRANANALVDRFLVPPFTVLDARQGYWQDRKRHWLSLGIKSEVGRDAVALRTENHAQAISDQIGTSVFDPVLCEVAYRWFSSPGAAVLDPFAGGSVRGIVAAVLGRHYTGIDLRPAQVEANRQQATEVLEERAALSEPVLSDSPQENAGENAKSAIEITNRWAPPTEDHAGATAQAAASIVAPYVKAGIMGRLPMGAYREAAAAGDLMLAVGPAGEVLGMVFVGGSGKSQALKIRQIARRESSPPGVGLAMLTWAIARAKERGKTRLELEVRPENARARAFYARNGFTEVEAKGENLLLTCPIPASEKPIPASATPRWFHGDSLDVRNIAPGEYDLLFSCPPYGDLEPYSDDPSDLSNMEYGQMIGVYRAIIGRCCGMLKQDRFAVWVVGDFRDGAGNLRGFVGDTVAAFRDAGLALYNDAVLVTQIGSLALRTGRQFTNSRKFGRTHQYVLTFVKGDAKKATEAAGQIVLPPDLEAAET